jgi:hypothetical protein
LLCAEKMLPEVINYLKRIDMMNTLQQAPVAKR